MSDSRRGKKNGNLTPSPPEIRINLKKEQTMKKWIKIAVWVVLAVAGSALIGGSLWWWLIGVAVGKVIIRLILTIALAVLLYVLFYALIIGGLFWILIS